jgi:uncharacterized membrane-anchored protein
MKPLRIILAGALLTAVLGWMIGERMLLLANGREIVVASQPVDPTDLFRGEYVILNFAFSRLELAQVQGLVAPGDGKAVNEDLDIYVTLKPEDGRYIFESASILRAESVAEGRVVIRGVAKGFYDIVMIEYGIERYFVPQGHGRDIETGIAASKVDVVLAVGADGTAAVRTLRLDGKDVYREGLF